MNEENRCAQCQAVISARSPHGLCPRCLLKRGLETQTQYSQEGCPAEAAECAPPTPEEMTDLFPDLEILELVGRGGMGVVYKARQKRLDRLIALKILSPRFSQDAAFAERFAREARAMAMLNHPHIVAVHDFGEIDGLYYFLMEFVDGLNLRRLLDTGKLASEEALAIVPQICDALQYAHDHGVVHRDIKPENVLLDKEGRVKIADFGIAKLVEVHEAGLHTQAWEVQGGASQGASRPNHEPLTEAGQVVGTPQYMAPEQIDTPQQVDHRADIYSLGVVFYQMLTGELPTGRFVPPSKKVQIDVRLDEVVLRAMEKEPERRYQQASEVKTEVEGIAKTLPETDTTDRASSDPSSASRPPVYRPVGNGRMFGVQLVTIRNGHPVVHWPHVWLLAVMLFFGGLIAMMAAYVSFAYVYATLFPPKIQGHGPSVVVELFGILLGLFLVFGWTMSFIMLVFKIRQGLIVVPEPLPYDDDKRAGKSETKTDDLFRQVREQVKGPAIGLLLTGIFTWLALPGVLWGIFRMSLSLQAQDKPDPFWVTVPITLMCVSIVVIFAALKMKHLQWYGFAVTASLLAILVSPSNLIGLPIGIWALVVLSQREVRDAFASGKSASSGVASPSSQSHRVATVIKYIIGSLVLLMAFIWTVMSHDIASLLRSPTKENVFRTDHVMAIATILGLLSLGIGILIIKKKNAVRVILSVTVVLLLLLCGTLFIAMANVASVMKYMVDMVDAKPSVQQADLNQPGGKIQPCDVLRIHAINTLLDQPIDGYYLVECDGNVSLGPAYGRANVKGMSMEQAEKSILKQLKKTLKNPSVQVILTKRSNRWRKAVFLRMPYTIEPSDLLHVKVRGALLDQPIDKTFRVESKGTVPLGPAYGRVAIKGLTLAEAEEAIQKHLETILTNPEVQVTLPHHFANSPAIRWQETKPPKVPYTIRPGELLFIDVMGALIDQPIQEIFLVEPGGTIALGPAYGRVKVSGLTLEEAEKAIQKKLKTISQDPQVSATLAGWIDKDLDFHRPAPNAGEEDKKKK